MCPWAGPHVPSFGRQLWGLLIRLEYLSPQGVLFPRVYGMIASPLWLELRGPAAWQATPSWTMYRLLCHRLLPWLRVMFAMVPDAAWPGSDQQPWGTAPADGPVGRLGRPSASNPWGVVCCYLFLGRPRCARVCGVHDPLALVHRCARPACSCVRCPWPLGTCSPVRAPGVFCVGCPWPLGACSPVRAPGALCVQCPWPLGASSPVRAPVGCGVLGRGAEPLVRAQFPEHPPSLNFGANHLKKWILHPQKPPIPFLSPHNPHHRGVFFGGGGGQRVRAELEHI